MEMSFAATSRLQTTAAHFEPLCPPRWPGRLRRGISVRRPATEAAFSRAHGGSPAWTLCRGEALPRGEACVRSFRSSQTQASLSEFCTLSIYS